MKIRLYEIDAHHKPSGHTHRWYLAAGSRGYQSRATDDPAAVTWLPLVAQWPSVQVEAQAAGGTARVDDLRLINVRAAHPLPRHANVYDVTAGVWLRVALGVRPLNVLLADYVPRLVAEKEVDSDAAYATAVTVWRARTGLMVPTRTDIRLPLWDRQRDFDAAIQVERYLGTGGLEGPAALKGATRERCFGWCPLVAPTYLGLVGGRHTFSVNGGHEIEGVPKGWNLAVPLTLVAGPPSTGQYSVDTGTGIVTVGGFGGAKPEDFRCEVQGDKTGGVWRRHIGAIIAHLATTHGGLAAAADIAGIDAVPRTVGLYLPAGGAMTHREAYGRLVGSVARGRWYVDLDDRVVATRLPRGAAATPTHTYRQGPGETPGLRPVARGRDVPARQVVVLHARNDRPSDGTAPAASADDAALWSQEWREAPSAVDAAVAAAWGDTARVERVETALTLRADAEAESALWLAELADPPQAYELPVADGAPGLWIADAVTVIDDVAGFETGATVVLTGRSNRDRGGGATLQVER